MPTAEINMTPLVDVMLVLLIIFIITAPLMTHRSRSTCRAPPARRRRKSR
jgi:biopolymer transport protein ExbD